MITTLLFDLDDTLLGNAMERFLPAYFQQLARHFELTGEPAKRLIDAVMRGTRAMTNNHDPNRDLLSVFNAEFYPALEWDPAVFAPRLEAFYRDVFPRLSRYTTRRAVARRLIQWAFAQRYQVVIATSPVFPLAAIKERLRWAGLAGFPFTLITSVENSHYTKPSPEYWAEILAHLGKRPEEALVIGNDWEADMAPAATLGLPHFWITAATPPPAAPDGCAAPLGSGDLEAFFAWAQANLPEPASAPDTPPQGLSYLLLGNLTEALLLTANLSEADWHYRPAEGAWSLTELACHLRDVEHEVNGPRLRAVIYTDNPFLSGADTDPWVGQRNYQAQSGPQAMQDFLAARKQAASFLRGITDLTWRRPARHALLGPTHLAELAGWMLDHDRLHLEQMRTTREKAIQYSKSRAVTRPLR